MIKVIINELFSRSVLMCKGNKRSGKSDLAEFKPKCQATKRSCPAQNWGYLNDRLRNEAQL
jgi:hypothetical protein